MKSEQFDLGILGGGTYGAAIAYTASLAGLSVALFEKGRIGKGTNGRTANYASTRMIQPGLKYVRSDLSIVRMDAFDCRLLRGVAGSVLEEKEFLLPIDRRYSFPKNEPWIWDIYLSAYDPYSRTALHEPHEMLTSAEVRRREPALGEDTVAAALYREWLVDPVGLAELFVSASKTLGVSVFEHADTESFKYVSKNGKRYIDEYKFNLFENIYGEVRCRYFVNATGAWLPRTAHKMGVSAFLRPTKGTSVVINKKLVEYPLVVFDKRMRFKTIIPFGDTTVIGPTNKEVSDEVYRNPDLLEPDEDEISDLLEVAHTFIAGSVSRTDIIEVKCGLRPLLPFRGDPYHASYQLGIFDHRSEGIENCCSVAGGKLSTQLSIARCVTAFVCKRLRVPFDWRVPYTRIRSDGSIERLGRAIVAPRRYRRRCALEFRNKRTAHHRIFFESKKQQFIAFVNLMYHTVRYAFSSVKI